MEGWDFCPCSVFSISSWSLCALTYTGNNVKLSHQLRTLPTANWEPCWGLLLTPSFAQLWSHWQRYHERHQDWCRLSWADAAGVCHQIRARVPRKSSSSFDHASFLFPAEICLLCTKGGAKGKFKCLTHPQTVSPLCPQPAPSCHNPLRPPPRTGRQAGAAGDQRKPGYAEVTWAAASRWRGWALKIAHTRISPLAEHPAPTHTLLLSPELQLGHTRSPTPLGAMCLLCFPRSWAVGQHWGPMSWVYCISSPSCLPRAQLRGD